ncbi:hypothetical protein ACLOJK_017979 [Asimina triloba]
MSDREQRPADDAALSCPLSSRLPVSATDGGVDGCDCLSRQPSLGRRSEGRMVVKRKSDERIPPSHSRLTPPTQSSSAFLRQSPIIFYYRRPLLSPSSTPFSVGRHRFPHSLLPLLHSRDNVPSSSTVVVRLCPHRLLHFRSAVIVSHILSSHLDCCLSRSPHLLHQSSFASGPSHFPASSAFVRISHRLLCSSSASSLAPFPASSPFSIGSPHCPRQSSPASVPALSLSSSPFPTTVLDSNATLSIPDRHHHFPHYTLPSSVSVPALSRLSSPTPTKAILAVVMLVLLP